MKTLACCLLSLVSMLVWDCHVGAQPFPVHARYVIVVADDFVVEAYHNGRLVPHSHRKLLVENFGTTVERINIDVKPGDWLVFNVVNDQQRWGGAYYFAAAGCASPGNFMFVSQRETGDWCVCDDPGAVSRFIHEKGYGQSRLARKVTRLWGGGTSLMRHYAGDAWNGEPLWGTSRNTWIKFVMPQ